MHGEANIYGHITKISVIYIWWKK